MRVIAVDFDGTLCENEYPNIGRARLKIIKELRKAKEQGAKVILWTCREGEKLDEALAWCEAYRITFDAINDNLKELTEQYGNNSRKVCATEYWDDKAIRR